MNILCVAHAYQISDINQLPNCFITLANHATPEHYQAANIIFDLTDTWQNHIEIIQTKTGLLHAPYVTNNGVPPQFLRINALPYFYTLSSWECSGTPSNELANTVQQIFQKKLFTVTDTIGLISFRIIAQIINEAFYTYGEGVASKQDIDTAMRLGTNYPLGPFTWCEAIGTKAVYNLLLTMQKENEKYKPAPAFTEHINQLPF
jgi:3-hydroxybutyryl-CoA dehydrogenase